MKKEIDVEILTILYVFRLTEKRKAVFGMPSVCLSAYMMYVNVVTCLVTRHGDWIGNWIYWLLTNRNYN
jgi:hypothetical protein